MRYLFCFLLFAVTGCTSLREVTRSSLTHEEMATVIARARTLALGSGLLRESERVVVESGDPKVACYLMSGVHYAQYSITWQFPDHQGVTVWGQGDLLSLDGAEVKRLPNKGVARNSRRAGQLTMRKGPGDCTCRPN